MVRGVTQSDSKRDRCFQHLETDHQGDHVLSPVVPKLLRIWSQNQLPIWKYYVPRGCTLARHVVCVINLILKIIQNFAKSFKIFENVLKIDNPRCELVDRLVLD